MQFTETTLPALERQRGARPFEMTPFMLFLKGRLDALKSSFHGRVDLRMALHRHPGVAGIVDAATELLKAVPGIELVDLGQPAIGLQSASMSVLPAYKKELQLRELEAASAKGVDALVAVYHSDHRELCAHERDWPFRIINILEIVGESMRLAWEDQYKTLKIKQDVDAILADSADLIGYHHIDLDTARKVIVAGMLGDQPLPLRATR